MEGLTRLVAESMARHGIDAPLDYRRLQWSHWFRCDSNLGRLLVPSMPGVLAVSEELVPADDRGGTDGRRVLVVFEVREALDLAIAIGCLLFRGGAIKERITNGRLFIRYTIIEDDASRHAVYRSFERWLAVANDTSSSVINQHGIQAGETFAVAQKEMKGQVLQQVQCPAPLPSGF